MTYRKKLIEVALPLKAINEASVREKSIRHGHPSTLHLWWSRKPLATCRAVLFASLVDDPSAHPDEFPSEQDQERERDRLFQLMEQLITWENSNNQEILAKARIEILKSTDGNPPSVLDPFCGGGSIPLEAQRLGLEAQGSDLNPVAVLISKALFELPPKFAGYAPVNPEATQSLMSRDWHRAQGLADDIRYYGKWSRDEAKRRIGHLYPSVTLPKEYGGGEATVIAWLWVRTVTCPNPACGATMPLTNKWWVSKKKGKEAWVEPVIDFTSAPPIIHFIVKTGKGQPQVGTVNRQGALCIACKTPVTFDYLRIEGKAKRMSAQLMAIVADGHRSRLYLSPNEKHELIATQAVSNGIPDTNLPEHALGFRVQLYGMTKHSDLFSTRQLAALTAISDLVQECRNKVLADIASNDASSNVKAHKYSNINALNYANAVSTYLAIAVDRLADRSSTICSWDTSYVKIDHTFARQAIPMIWNFAESNPMSESTGNFLGAIEWIAEVVQNQHALLLVGLFNKSNRAGHRSSLKQV